MTLIAIVKMIYLVVIKLTVSIKLFLLNNHIKTVFLFKQNNKITFQ